MANINIENISDLDLSGNDLFQDSESFIVEIDDNDQEATIGGLLSWCICTNDCCITKIEIEI